MSSFIALLLLLSTVGVSATEQVYSEYDCLLCCLAVENAQQSRHLSFLDSCADVFGRATCGDFAVFASDFDVPMTGDPRAICATTKNNVCSDLHEESWRSSPRKQNLLSDKESGAVIDVRVSKGYGSRGYDKVRISVISNASVSMPPEIFTYSQQFQYKWTDKYLSSGVVSVIPGEKTIFNIAGEDFAILIPVKGQGTRGVIIADPCFTNEFVWCSYGEKMNMFNRSTEILNAINSHDDSDFWMILGDNFYDQSGLPSSEWFSALSTQTKSKVFGSVPGNHDFWIFSAPLVWTKRDQLANGFMQFYGQDVAASIENEASGSFSPYDFSVEPVSRDSIPAASNFFWYYVMGNAGFIGYSGAHSYEEMVPYFQEACNYMVDENPDAVLLLGHWNTAGLGCPWNLTVPRTFQELMENVTECAPLNSKMRYMMGHTHCNMVTEPDVGFMVAGQGMTASHLPCDGDYGIPVVDTHDGKFDIYYFDIQNYAAGMDNYETILDCISTNGVSQCYHLASSWTSIPF